MTPIRAAKAMLRFAMGAIGLTLTAWEKFRAMYRKLRLTRSECLKADAQLAGMADYFDRWIARLKEMNADPIDPLLTHALDANAAIEQLRGSVMASVRDLAEGA